MPAVVFGGPSPEHDISVLTGLQAARLLTDAGRQIEAIYWSKTGKWYQVDPGLEAADFADGVPAKARELHFVAEPGAGWQIKRKPLGVDVALLALHGGPGEDGSIQGALDLAGIRYSGPDAAGSMLGMDKLAFGAAVANAGLPSLPRALVTSDTKPDFEPPYIVKPRFGGSSIGIEVVDDLATAQGLTQSSPHMRRGAVVEPFIEASRDLNIAIRTYPELELSAIEAPERTSGFYDYAEKYLSGGGLEGSARQLPADDALPKGMVETIHTSAVAVAGLVGVRSVARLDFLEHDGTVWVNEINTIPGTLSMYLWVDPPISRTQLVSDLLTEVEESKLRTFTTAGADGMALRSAEAISKKLG